MNTQIELRKKYNCTLHHCMSMTGGFLAAYAILLRSDFMGNAQTANWLYLVFALLGHNFFETFLRFLAVILYILGAMAYVYTNKRTKKDVRMISIIIDICAMILLGFLPENLNPVIGLMPIFFAMSFQWNSFPGEYGFVSSTIFSTNNTRQIGLSLAEAILDRTKKPLAKTRFFIGSIVFFHIGAAISYFCVRALSVRASWIGILLLVPSILFLRKVLRMDISEKNTVAS